MKLQNRPCLKCVVYFQSGHVWLNHVYMKLHVNIFSSTTLLMRNVHVMIGGLGIIAQVSTSSYFVLNHLDNNCPENKP
jgi:hypothetical protein